MKPRLNILLLVCCTLMFHTVICQPSNDLCSNATNLGTLGTPIACQRGGIVDLLGETTAGATPSPFFPVTACSLDSTKLPRDVWYKFKPTGDSIVITVANATFANPRIAVYSGNCSNMQMVSCFAGNSYGASLILTTSLWSTDTALYIQISGIDSSQSGVFDLDVRNYYICPGTCLVTSNLTVTPQPVSGHYAAGQRVNFCFEVTNWQSVSANWFHGVLPTFGAGWDTSTFAVTQSSPPCTIGGIWGWYPHGDTSSANNDIYGPGFYYETASGNANGLTDNDPGDNYGDDNQANTCTWNFCFSIKTKQNLSPGIDLSVSIRTTSDGESGSWTSTACNNDSVTVFNALSSCISENVTNDTICPGLSVMFQGQQVSQPGTYIDSFTNALGCDSLVILHLAVIPVQVTTLSVQNVGCTGDSNGVINIFTTGGKSPYIYHWSDGETSSNITGLLQGIYCLTVQDANLCSSTICDTVPANEGCVWPGDADNNGLVDNNDLLPIGLEYDSAGLYRPVYSIIWQADISANWQDTLISGLNYKYADCNGDGIVDINDTLPIVQNFSLTHPKTNVPERPRSNTPALHAVALEDTLYNGQILNVGFILGDSLLNVSNFYGIAFTYNFDPAVVDSTFTTMSYGDSWIGTATDKISLVKIWNATGQIKTAVTRIDHTTRSGNGSIGVASFRITNQNITTASYSNIGFISDITAIDSTGRPININVGADTSTVMLVSNGVQEIADESISMTPNPAKNKIQISADSKISSILVSDVLGQIVADQKNVGLRRAEMDVSGWPNGLYIVQVGTEKSHKTLKLLIEK